MTTEETICWTHNVEVMSSISIADAIGEKHATVVRRLKKLCNKKILDIKPLSLLTNNQDDVKIIYEKDGVYFINIWMSTRVMRKNEKIKNQIALLDVLKRTKGAYDYITQLKIASANIPIIFENENYDDLLDREGIYTISNKDVGKVTRRGKLFLAYIFCINFQFTYFKDILTTKLKNEEISCNEQMRNQIANQALGYHDSLTQNMDALYILQSINQRDMIKVLAQMKKLFPYDDFNYHCYGYQNAIFGLLRYILARITKKELILEYFYYTPDGIKTLTTRLVLQMANKIANLYANIIIKNYINN